jgi:hypothetical protein
MGCKIVVTRDDTGAELSNEELAKMLRSLTGVISVRIEHAEEPDVVEVCGEEWLGEIRVVRDPDCPPGKFFLRPAPTNTLLFASNKPGDVDAYVARQAERMGHTEIHRG